MTTRVVLARSLRPAVRRATGVRALGTPRAFTSYNGPVAGLTPEQEEVSERGEAVQCSVWVVVPWSQCEQPAGGRRPVNGERALAGLRRASWDCRVVVQRRAFC